MQLPGGRKILAWRSNRGQVRDAIKKHGLGQVLFMIWFGILFGIDSIIALVAVYFFVVGLTDGSVSSFNMLLWLALLGGIAAVLGGSILLTRSGYRRRANALLLVPALPGFALGLLLLLAVILQPRWN